MTAEKQDITSDFYQLTHKDIQVTIVDDNGNLKDLSQCELSYALIFDNGKVRVTKLMKSSTTGDIEVTGLGKCVIHYYPADTQEIYGTYRHQLHVHDENGYDAIAMTGRVDILRSFIARIAITTAHAYLVGSLA